MNTWPLRGGVMMDIPFQYRPSYRHGAFSSTETAPSSATTASWDGNGWKVAYSEEDTHRHPAFSEAVDNFDKDDGTEPVASHPIYPTLFRHYRLPHLYEMPRQCPPGLRNPFVGIALEERKNALPPRRETPAKGVTEELPRDARLAINRCLRNCKGEPGQDTTSFRRHEFDLCRFTITGYSFPIRKLAQDVFIPRCLDYRSSWHPADLVYDVDFPLKPSTVQHFDVVRTWKHLSFIQAAEILHWEDVFKAVLAAKLQSVPGLSDSTDPVTVQNSPNDQIQESYVSLHLNLQQVVLDMVESVNTGNTAFGWFASTRDILRTLLRFLRNLDCFVDPLQLACAANARHHFPNTSMKVRKLPRCGLSTIAHEFAEVEVLWNPGYVSFHHFDPRIEEGQVLRLKPSFCCHLKEVFEDALSRSEISITYSTDVEWLRYDHRHASFAGRVPVRPNISEAGSEDSSLDYILDVIIKAKVTEYFGLPTLEQTIRTQIRLTVVPKKIPKSKGSNGRVSSDKIEPGKSSPYRKLASRRCQSRNGAPSDEIRERRGRDSAKPGDAPSQLDIQTHLRDSQQFQSYDYCADEQENLVMDTTGAEQEMTTFPASHLSLDIDRAETFPQSILQWENAPLRYEGEHRYPPPRVERSMLAHHAHAASEGNRRSYLPKPVTQITSKVELPSPENLQYRQYSTVPACHGSRFDDHAADLEAQFRSWKFSKKQKPGRQVDYFMDFAASTRGMSRRRLPSSHDWDDATLSERCGYSSRLIDLFQHPGFGLPGHNRVQNAFPVSQQPVMPLTPPETEGDAIASGQNLQRHEIEATIHPVLIAHDSSCISRGGTEVSGGERISTQSSTNASRADFNANPTDLPLIRPDETLGLLLRMRQINEAERMSLGTNAEAIWFSSENNSEISYFGALGTVCSDADIDTIVIVDDDGDADDEAEEADNGHTVVLSD